MSWPSVKYQQAQWLNDWLTYWQDKVMIGLGSDENVEIYWDFYRKQFETTRPILAVKRTFAEYQKFNSVKNLSTMLHIQWYKRHGVLVSLYVCHVMSWFEFHLNAWYRLMAVVLANEIEIKTKIASDSSPDLSKIDMSFTISQELLWVSQNINNQSIAFKKNIMMLCLFVAAR